MKNNMKNMEEINKLKMDANTPKHSLIEIASKLEEYGAIRESKSLFTIIGKLEAWQNK